MWVSKREFNVMVSETTRAWERVRQLEEQVAELQAPPPGTYAARVHCANCGHTFETHIQRGVAFEEAKAELVCETCGCKGTLEKAAVSSPATAVPTADLMQQLGLSKAAAQQSLPNSALSNALRWHYWFAP